jgi:hypothetical protein
MTIQFYLNDENETHVHTFFDVQSNPFTLGDTINLSVDEIPPRKYENFKPNAIKHIRENHKHTRDLFHLNKIKLIKESKYIELESDKLTIEYHCELIININRKIEQYNI